MVYDSLWFKLMHGVYYCLYFFFFFFFCIFIVFNSMFVMSLLMFLENSGFHLHLTIL
jgi:hypothetical protein